MNRLVGRLPAPVILIAAPVLTLLIGIAVMVAATRLEERGRWRQWAAPPDETIAQLITASEDYVVVETTGGAVYRLTCPVPVVGDNCWIQLDAPPEDLILPCHNYDLPPPPGPVKALIRTCIEYEFTILTQYALLDDGTLWRWQVEIFPLARLVQFIRVTVVSLVLGILAGVGILRLRKDVSNATE